MNQSRNAKATQGKPKNANKQANNRNRNRPHARQGQGRVQERMTTAPVAKAFTERKTAKPQYISHKNGDIEVSFREYIQDITSTVAFSSLPIALNPGNAALFPWLSQLATRFELYSFRKLEFNYEPSTTTANTGTFLMAIDFDPSDTIYSSKQEFLNTRSHARCAPWDSCVLRTVKEDLTRRKTFNVRDISSFADADAVGTFYYGTVGNLATLVPIGELYVTYTVLLQSPQVSALRGRSMVVSNSTGLNSTQYWGALATYAYDGTQLFDWTNASVVTVNSGLPVNQYLMVLQVVGTGFGTGTQMVQNGTAPFSTLTTSVNSSGTGVLVYGVVTLKNGNTINLSLASSTVTSVLWRFSLYDYTIA